MPKIIHTDQLTPNSDPWLGLLIYNGFDNAITHEVYEVLKPKLDAAAQLVYDFTFASQAPAMAMMLRGIKIDEHKREELIGHYMDEYTKAVALLTKITLEGFGLNVMAKKDASGTLLKKLLYEGLRLPIQYKYDKVSKERKPTVNREALEKLSGEFPICRPIVSMIMALRDANKKLQVLHTATDTDGRMRFGYQVAGTWTGRWSSNESAFGSGTNGQNITDLMREMFRSDPGWQFGNVDLKQAEAKNVAYLANDEAYINACLSGDIHTVVAMLCYPDVDWPKDPKEARKLAEEKYYRDFSRRDLGKRGAHGSNYYAKAFTIAANLKIPLPIAIEFQKNYFGAFKGIPKWHQKIQRDIQQHNYIITPLGRRIYFFGDPFLDETLRAAIAAGPQSMTGDILNVGLWRVWDKFERQEKGKRLQLLGQIHDAILFQFRPQFRTQILKEVADLVTIPVEVNNRTMILEPELSVGWNWRKVKFNKDGTITNPNGLLEWKGDDKRSEPVYKTTPPLLARRVCATY